MHKILRTSVIGTFATLCFAGCVVADIKCSCPEIKADGEGNSSCSANESGGRCTIDYNLFADREIRAAGFLKSELGLDFTPFADANTEEALWIAEQEGFLFDQVFLYLNIAAASQKSRYSETVPDGNFKNLLELTGEFRSAILAAFNRDTRDKVLKGGVELPSDAFVRQDYVVISPGCIEAIVDDQWVMFKTSWALTAEEPRCGG